MGDPRTATTQDAAWLKLADWLSIHESLLEQCKRMPDAQIVFLGDSITQGWGGEGKATWDRLFAPRKSLNLGIGGDETQHILWRIERGALDGIAPKVLVLLIGTNNIGNSGHTGIESAAGVKLVVDAIRHKLPHTKILLLAVLPRDEQPGTAFRREVAALNGVISRLHDGKTVFYVDLGDRFLEADGILPKRLFPDSLHLSAEAYAILGREIDDQLKPLLG